MTTGSASALPLTGERTVPGLAEENYWFRRHEAAYAWLEPLVRARRVLEVGSGEGYGTARIAAGAAVTVGVDYDAAAIAHAARRYPAARFVRANLAALPLPSAAVEVVVSLQVVEHVWNHREYLAECARVLVPDGLLVLSTPNRLTFSPGSAVPLNPFHTREFTGAELAELLGGSFTVEAVLGLHTGPALAELDRRHGGSFVAAQLAAAPAQWSAGLAADVAGVGTGDFEIRPGGPDLDACLDLIVLARPR